MSRLLALVLIVFTLPPLSALALTAPLSPEQVREAYYIGRNPERRQDFFTKYIHFPAEPDTGPDVHLIEFRTPYEQVALRSQEHWANYDALDAERDYASEPNEVLVRVLICDTFTFSFATPPHDLANGKTVPWLPEDYLRGFEFSVSQAVPINPKKLTVRQALLGCADFDGFEAFLRFGAKQFTSGVATVQVVAPDRHIYRTTFDLDDLK